LGGHWNDADCGESAGDLTVGQIAEIKDKLVENDKKLADAVKDVNDKIENGELKGEKGDKGDKGEESRAKRAIKVIKAIEESRALLVRTAKALMKVL